MEPEHRLRTVFGEHWISRDLKLDPLESSRIEPKLLLYSALPDQQGRKLDHCKIRSIFRTKIALTMVMITIMRIREKLFSPYENQPLWHAAEPDM